MGKGDKRTAMGKRYRKSFGNTRPKPKKLRAIAKAKAKKAKD